MTHKDATKTKACCNCLHCTRVAKEGYIDCVCDVDGHWQSYLEVMTLRCELWEKEK